MTTPEELRDVVRFLQGRIELGDGTTIVFNVPTAEDMIAAGLDETAARSMTGAPWWPEMVDDVIETPDFAEPGDSPARILGYARDVVQEYVWKRFDLEN